MLVIAPKTSRHMDAEEIEKYSMGDIPEELSARFEEHLLLCAACRNRVKESDDYVRSMQLAGGKIRGQPSGGGRSAWTPRWIAIFAVAALIAAVGIFGLSRGARNPAFAVSLAAMRGSEPMAKVPAGAPLVLNPDLTGLPVSVSYRVEVVDAVGNTVWRGAFPVAKVPPRRAGIYFVRIYAGGGELLREYGLRIR